MTEGTSETRDLYLPDSLASITADIIKLISDYRDLQSSSHQKVLQSFGGPGEIDPTAIAILGDRGSGKTSLLYSVLRYLAPLDDYIILPVIRPEYFLSESETIISSFLASLTELVAGSNESIANISHVSSNLIRSLHDASRNYGISRAPISPKFALGVNPLEFADESVMISRSGLRMYNALQNAIQDIGTTDHAGPAKTIVLPIDDPDMVDAGSVADNLRDLSILASLPGLVPIYCLSKSDVFSGWVNGAAVAVGRNRQQQAQLFERVITKLMPYYARFQIDPITDRERVAFRPLGTDLNLGTQITELATAFSALLDQESTIANGLLELARDLELPTPLPSNARSLAQICRTLGGMNRGLTAPNWRETSLVAQRLLDILCGPLDRLLFNDNIDGRLLSVNNSGTHHSRIERTEMRLNQHNVRIFVQADGRLDSNRQRLLTGFGRAGRLCQVIVRPVRAVKARVGESSDSQEKTDQILSADDLSTFLMIQEIALSGMFDFSGELARLGLANWNFLQRVTLFGQSTDDYFLILPVASTLSEMRVLCRSWNALADRNLRSGSVVGMMCDLARVSMAFTEDCREVQRRFPDPYQDPEQLESIYGGLIDQASELYEQTVANDDSRSQAFCEWYRVVLPLQWFEGFLSRSAIRRLCRTHAATVGPDKSSTSETSVSGLFETRLRPILSAVTADSSRVPEFCWVGGYADVIDYARPDALAEFAPEWRRLLSAWRERWTGSVAGASGVAEAVNISNSYSKALSPYENERGTRLFNRAMSTLKAISSQELGR